MSDQWEWVRESPASWDEQKAAVLDGLEPALFGLGTPAPGDALGDEWWRVQDGDGQVLGYGRLDDTWGDAEVLVLVSPRHRRSGVGRFAMSRLEHEAGRRRLNYIYNVIPQRHPAPEPVAEWLAAQGFVPNDVGELRKQIPAAERTGG